MKIIGAIRLGKNSDEKVCSFDNTLLDTYYEAREDCIIEFNKHFDNVRYYSFARIVELLNVKEMRLEGCQKGNLKISELLDENEVLRKEKRELAERVKILEKRIEMIEESQSYHNKPHGQFNSCSGKPITFRF